MNKERKILLAILFLTILSSSLTIVSLQLKEKRSFVKDRIDLLEKQLHKIEQRETQVPIDEINYYIDEIANEKMRYFDNLQTDPFQFAIEIKSLLESKGLVVNSYKTIENDDKIFIEFSIEGSSLSLFDFLEVLEGTEKNYLFPQFSIKNEKRGISSVFRIGYMVYE